MKARTSAWPCALALFTIASPAHAAETLLFETEREVPVAELLDLLDILPGVDTQAQVSASADGPFGASAALAGDLACRVEGDDVILSAGDGPAAAATCHVRVCTTVLLLRLCGTTALELESVACFEDGTGLVDPGCDGDAPVCDDGACVGCTEDSHCGPASGAFGLGLGQTTNVTLGLLHELLGLDLLLPLSTVQVGAHVSGPFSDEALLDNGATCAIADDGGVDLEASAEDAGASTCYVEVCVPALGTCLVTGLDVLVDGCLLGGQCDPVGACDRGSNTCLACRDEEDAGAIDPGCSSPTPVCHEGDGAPVCVACETAADCGASLLTVQLGPNRAAVVALAQITGVLRLGSLLAPSSVRVGADVDGPFDDAAALDGARCSVGAGGAVLVAASGVEGETTCFVQVCATLLGNTVETCLGAPIHVKVDACVLDRSCDLGPRCDALACSDACLDSAPPGGIDQGCDADAPACAGGCVGCLADEDCAPRRPRVELDLGDSGVVLLDEILAALGIGASAPVDSVQVGAAVAGPFGATALLDDGTRCMVGVDGDVEVLAPTAYGRARCYVEVCAGALASSDGCAVLPIDVRTDPCAATGSCRPQICDVASSACTGCIDDGDAIDAGCDADSPVCGQGEDGEPRCHACERDDDCGGGDVCHQHTCVPCSDTGGGVDVGCSGSLPSCDTQPIDGGAARCVGCTLDADCVSGLCDEPTRGCVTCQDSAAGSGLDAGCDGVAPICAGGERCVACDDDDDCDEPTPFCLDDGDAPSCVACSVDADCGDGEVCHAATHACVDPDGVIALDDRFTVGFGLVLTVASADGVLANDSAPGGPLEARVIAATLPAAATVGVVALAPDGSLVFTPALGYSGSFDFGYEVIADGSVAASASVTITVGANRPPQAGDETVRTVEDVAMLVVVLANERDPEGQTVVLDDVAEPRVGAIEVLDDGSVLYLPAPDFAGDDAFDYHVCDSFGACAEATVRVTVGADNDAPRAADDRVVLAAPGEVTVEVLGNDGDPDGDALHIGELDLAGLAGAAIVRDGRVVVTASGGGETGFGYEACDAAGACASAFVVVQVGGEPSDGVDARDDVLDTRVAATLDLLANDHAQGGTLVIAAWTAPDHGQLAVSARGEVTYRPAVGFTGDDAFRYTACAGRTCDVAGVRVTVRAGDDVAPIALDDLVTTLRDVAVSIDVGANDLDPDGDALMLRAVKGATHGHAAMRSDGAVAYTPGAGFTGRDTFEVEIGDGRGGVDRSTVTVLVLDAPNAPPVAQDDRYSVSGLPLGGPPLASTIDVLFNDSDTDGDALDIDVIVQPRNGLARFDAAGDIVYRPAAGYVGADRFEYRVSDGRGGFDEALVTIEIGAPNLVPSVLDDLATTPEESPVTIAVLGNDADPEGDPLAFTITSDPRSGRAEVLVDGRVRYVPAPDFFGTDGFVYTACDEHDACASAAVVIEVTPVNDAPVARDDRGTMLGAVGVTLDVLGNDSDVDDAQLVIGRVGAPAIGSVAVLAGGELALLAPVSFTGLLTFTYDACDAGGLCATATVRVDVAGKSSAPELVDDLATTQANVEVTVDVLVNDADPEGDTLALDTVGRAGYGTVRVVAGRLAYLPAEDYVGLDSFTYIACDLGGLCGQARVSVTVTIPVTNDAPYAVDDSYDASTPKVHRIDVMANDGDPDGDRLHLTSVTQGAQGSASLGSDGKLVYTPAHGARGDDVLTYTICDTWNVCDSARVAIALTPSDFGGYALTGGPACSNGGAAPLMALVFALSFLAVRRALRRDRVSRRGSAG